MKHKFKLYRDDDWRNELKTVNINGQEWKYECKFFSVKIYEPYKKTGKEYVVDGMVSPQTIKKFIIANIIRRTKMSISNITTKEVTK